GPKRQVALAAGQIGGADLVSGPHRPRMRGVGREKTLKGGDAQVHARVVGRIGNAERRGNLDEGACADALRVLVGVGRLRPLDVAYEIGPGQPGLERLTGLALGLAKVKSSGQAVCSAGILLEVALEMIDRPGEVPRHL